MVFKYDNYHIYILAEPRGVARGTAKTGFNAAG